MEGLPSTREGRGDACGWVTVYKQGRERGRVPAQYIWFFFVNRLERQELKGIGVCTGGWAEG